MQLVACLHQLLRASTRLSTWLLCNSLCFSCFCARQFPDPVATCSISNLQSVERGRFSRGLL